MEVIRLENSELPSQYYNIVPDLPEKIPPPLNPETKEPMKPESLEAIFPENLVKQEMMSERKMTVPEEVRKAYLRLGRPTPLYRAKRLEEIIGTDSKIYFKREDSTVTGSHKANTALAQAYFNRKEGVKKLTTETGAGQWGTALSMACKTFGMECEVYMVRCSYEQKPERKTLINLYGGDLYSSPSENTDYGVEVLEDNPNSDGSLGIAISEAIEVARKEENTNYALGSVLNHVMMHQTVIGKETLKQFEKVGEKPDLMIGCVGGGSNFSGFTLPAIGSKLREEDFEDTEFIGVEPEEVPTLSEGEYRYDHGDTAGMTPLLKMYTLGKDFMPEPIYASGLRYHGAAPILSLLKKHGLVKPRTCSQAEAFKAAKLFAKTEGIIPAPESAYAIREAIERAKKDKDGKVIAFNLSGQGLVDLKNYQRMMG